MNHLEHWHPKDKAELADIEASVLDARKRRKRLFTRIRQRAWQAKRKAVQHDHQAQ